MANGRRKDGKPYKDGNTASDGSYRVGKNRTPEQTRFAVDDGRKRGRRPKGVRTFDKDWEEELSKPVRVIRNGKSIKVSAHHAQVMKTLELASKGKERSQELIFRQAERLGERKRQLSSKSDDELIADWLVQQLGPSPEPAVVSDDRDQEDKSSTNEEERSDDPLATDDQ
jgi:hypothetical protein